MRPTATYRLQLQPRFPFAAAEAAVPYLAGLGISHLHLSPVLEAVPGSTHGYDVTDHGRIREELGGEEGLRSLARSAGEHGLGLLVDLVPNHMAVPAPESLNQPLWEVLREGQDSPYAHWFDIDWTQHGGRLLMPVLGGRLPTELAKLRVDGEVLRYGEHAFPLRSGTAELPLPELLEAQHYRLAWWRLARTELNYRRFFTITSLIGVRVEEPEVFEATHAKVLQLIREGVIEGLRIDHPDGLADPGGYLRKLREAAGPDCRIVVEKILTGEEQLPHWPVAGTTGYDALRHIDGLFLDPLGVQELKQAYRDFTQAPTDRGGNWRPTARRAARKVVTQDLAAEISRLGRSAEQLSTDHAPAALRLALREILIRLPVYRPYTRPDAATVHSLHDAAERARRAFAVPAEAEAVEVIRDAALGGDAAFAARFAQTAAALHAKAYEDTAFYRYAPLLSVCEVGGDPGSPAVSPERFHAYCAHLQRHWPASSTVLSTHDTKRSADVRARLATLSEYPAAWRSFADLKAPTAPDPHLAWTAWQTAYGLGLPHPERLVPTLLKAVREAGLRTSWTEPDEAYEAAVEEFVRSALNLAAESSPDHDAAAAANMLGAALLHLTMPGVPDLYQGTESPYYALVDPDNRRPAGFPNASRGPKEHLTRKALRLRRAHPEYFDASAGYAPLHAEGERTQHCVAFTRAGSALTLVTRLSAHLAAAGGWGSTRLQLPQGRWRDELTEREFDGGRPTALAELLASYPVALLVRS